MFARRIFHVLFILAIIVIWREACSSLTGVPELYQSEYVSVLAVQFTYIIFK